MAIPDTDSNWRFETKQIHAGLHPDAEAHANALPIYQTAAYVFKDAEQAAGRFALTDQTGSVYGRINNETNAAIENRIAALEGGVGALLVSSGQAATTFSILNLAKAGDHIVSSASLYGGTYSLFEHTLNRFGIETTFVEHPENPDEWQAAVRPNTKAFYGESIPNPKNDVFDFEAVAKVAHANGVPLIVDNTVATPYLVRPFEWGVDIVVHSATKFLGGHGTTIGGVIVDSGNFDWVAHNDKFDFDKPDPAYHGLVYTEAVGNLAYIVRARTQFLRDVGAQLSPLSSWIIGLGIETLSLRLERHVSNAQALAEWLEARNDVTKVYYAGLPSSPSHKLAQKYLPNGAGSVLAFDIEGGLEAGKAFVSALTLHSHVANIGDVKSLVIHPASTTHSQLTPEEQLQSGVTPSLVRLSVGIENIADIKADLEKGFAAAAATR